VEQVPTDSVANWAPTLASSATQDWTVNKFERFNLPVLPDGFLFLT
jgi:hypothetical protein